MKVFIICSVRGTDSGYKEYLEKYAEDLETQGVEVHLPHRDTDQDASGYDICLQNAKAIREADEVHIFYKSTSQGTHFDMGVSFAMGKKLVVVENEVYGIGKSFPRMLDEWQRMTSNKIERLISCPRCGDPMDECCSASSSDGPYFGTLYNICTRCREDFGGTSESL